MKSALMSTMEVDRLPESVRDRIVSEYAYTLDDQFQYEDDLEADEFPKYKDEYNKLRAKIASLEEQLKDDLPSPVASPGVENSVQAWIEDAFLDTKLCDRATKARVSIDGLAYGFFVSPQLLQINLHAANVLQPVIHGSHDVVQLTVDGSDEIGMIVGRANSDLAWVSVRPELIRELKKEVLSPGSNPPDVGVVYGPHGPTRYEQIGPHHYVIPESGYRQGHSGSPFLDSSGRVVMAMLGDLISAKEKVHLLVRVTDFDVEIYLAQLNQILPGYTLVKSAGGKGKTKKGRGRVRKIRYGNEKFTFAPLTSTDYERRRAQYADELGYEPTSKEMYERLQQEDRDYLIVQAYGKTYVGHQDDEDGSVEYSVVDEDPDDYDDALRQHYGTGSVGEILFGTKKKSKRPQIGFNMKKVGPPPPPMKSVGDWTKVKDDNGDEYWWNTRTNETSWDGPRVISVSGNAATVSKDEGAVSQPDVPLCVPKELRAAYSIGSDEEKCEILILALDPTQTWRDILSKMLPDVRLAALLALEKPSKLVEKPVTKKAIVAANREKSIADLTAIRDNLRKEVQLRDSVFLNDEEKEKFPEVTWQEELLRKEIKKMQVVKRIITENEKQIAARKEAALKNQKVIDSLTSKVANLGFKLADREEDF